MDPYTPDDFITSVTLEADFMQKKTVSQEQFDSDEMAKEFLYAFPNQVFTVGQQLGFSFKEKILVLVVKDIEVVNINTVKSNQDAKPKKNKIGQLFPNTAVQFEKAEASSLNLVGKSRGYKTVSLTRIQT